MKHIRLLIVDDHPVVRAGLRMMLANEQDFEIVGEATTGEDAIQLVAQLAPDVVLMDLRMPGMDGVEATATLRKRQPRTQVLIITTYESNTDILRALEAGAVGYLLKDTPKEQLTLTIRNAVEGKPVLTPEITRKLLSSLQTARTMSEERLSEREIEVLTLVARGESNKNIARHLHISEATVKTHLVRIFGRLGVEDRTAAVVIALERGLLHLNPSC